MQLLTIGWLATETIFWSWYSPWYEVSAYTWSTCDS